MHDVKVARWPEFEYGSAAKGTPAATIYCRTPEIAVCVLNDSRPSVKPIGSDAGEAVHDVIGARRLPLCANDDETSTARKFTLEGVGDSSWLCPIR